MLDTSARLNATPYVGHLEPLHSQVTEQTTTTVNTSKGSASDDDKHRVIDALLRQLAYVPVTFVGLIYAAGFIIMTNVFARWRVPAFELLRERYLTAGLYYLVISASIVLIVVLGAACLISISRYIQALRSLQALPKGPLSENTRVDNEYELARRSYNDRKDDVAVRLYAFLACTALVSFPIAILFFSRPPRSRYVLLFFYGMYAGGILFLGALRLIQRNIGGRSMRPKVKMLLTRIVIVTRWLTILAIWFFGIDILAALNVPYILVEALRFYAIFLILLTMQSLFLLRPEYRKIGTDMLGHNLFWTALPIGMFIVLYLSMVTFAFQVYPNIPAGRGGGNPSCVDIEVEELPEVSKVSYIGKPSFNQHLDLLLLDDRSEVVHLTSKLNPDGSVSEIQEFPRTLVRSVKYHEASPPEFEVMDGFKQVIATGFWRCIWCKLVSIQDLSKECVVKTSNDVASCCETSLTVPAAQH